MDIFTHEKKINMHTIAINDDEVSDVLLNPDPFLDKLRELLDREPDQAEKKTRRPYKKSKAKSTTRKSGFKYAKEKCPQCGRMIANNRMPRHIATKHSED